MGARALALIRRGGQRTRRTSIKLQLEQTGMLCEAVMSLVAHSLKLQKGEGASATKASSIGSLAPRSAWPPTLPSSLSP